MKRGNQSPGGVLQKTEEKAILGRYSHSKYRQFLEEASDRAAPTKELNILFIYNGHSWDAYEVLGVPAGANLVDVTSAYQQTLRTADPESHEFLETAFKAILAKK